MTHAVDNDWFWNEVETEVGTTLDEKARGVINTALRRRSEHHASDDATSSGSDIRLSFFSHYLVLKWGREKRSPERLKEDRKQYPVLTRENLITLFVTWLVALAALYTLTSVAVYFLSKLLQA